MASSGPNPNITTIVAKAIPDQVVVVVDVITMALFINQNSVQHMGRMLQVPEEKPFLKALQKQ